MATPANIMREVHRLRRHAGDLQAQIDRAPRLVDAQKNKVSRQEEILREAQDALKKLKVSILDKESTLKTTHQQIAKHTKQLNDVEGKKQYDALQTEIANDRKACQKLEEEILEAMGKVEEDAARIPELEKAVQQAKTEAAEVERNAQSRHAGLVEQLALAQQQIKEVEATVPEKILAQFERLIRLHSEDALSAVNGRTCVSCYTEITAQDYNQLLMGQFLVCKSCGRMLYLPEQGAG